MIGPRQLAGRAGRIYRSAVVRRTTGVVAGGRARPGRGSGDKSGEWKDRHHQGRALVECLELVSPT